MAFSSCQLSSFLQVSENGEMILNELSEEWLFGMNYQMETETESSEKKSNIVII